MIYRENEIYGSSHENVAEKLGIKFDSKPEPAMEKYENIGVAGVDFAYFFFSHHIAGVNGIKRYINIIDGNLFYMKKADGDSDFPRLWESKEPKITFYDDNKEFGALPIYKFRGVFQYYKSTPDKTGVYFKKIGNILIIDEKTKVVSWRKI